MSSGLGDSPKKENMSHNEALAAAAHLHVLLRRKTGRVTDTEWMASNADYAHAIVRYAREKATSEGHTDLMPLADRLEALMPRSDAPARLPLLEAVRARDDLNDQDNRYIGRLR